MATLKEMIEEREAAERAASENHGSTSQSAENKPKNVGGFGGGLEYLGSQFLNGLLQNVEGMTDFVSGGLADLFGNEEYAKKVFSEDWFNYDAATEKFNPGTAWKVAGDVASVIGGAVPDIAIGYGVGAIGAGLGTAGKVLSKGVQAATSFSSAGGRAMSEAVNTTGELGAKEWAGGAGSGGLAAGIELVSGAVGSALGGGFGKTAVEMGSEISESSAKRMSKEAVGAVLSKATGKEAAEEAGESGVKKLINSIFKSKTGKEILGEFISEGAEESFETLIEPEIKQNTYNYDAPDATLNDVLYSFILGGGAGAGIRGGTLGISAAVNNVQNFTRGAKIYGSQSKLEALMHNAEVISNYESEKQTGSEVFEAVQATYEKVKQSLDSGKVLSKRQYGEIGQLERLVATSVLEPLTVKTAVDLARNKERTTEILNSYYKQKGIDKLITPEELIAGLDTQHGDRAFVKSVRRALSDNSLLRDVVLNNMLGRLSFDAMNYANSIYDGTKISTIATQENINRFLAKADKATLAEVGAALGIRDWANLTPDELAKAIKAFRDSGRAELYRGGYEAAKRAASFSGDAVTLPSADGRLEILSSMADGVTRYRSDGMDIAIVKEGDKYRLYDYESGKITRQMTLDEMNELLSNIEERIADFKAESEMAALDREIDKFAEENIPEYKKLTSSEREAVRETIRRARANGASEADQILFGRVAAKSGLKIVPTKNIPDSKDGRSALSEDLSRAAWFDGKNTVYIKADGSKVDIYSGLLGHEMFHKMFKSTKVKKLFMEAWNNTPESKRQEVIDRYMADMKQNKELTAAERINISNEEVAAAYAQELFNSPDVWDFILEGEPSLSDRIIKFFGGVPKRYAFADGMDAAAKRWLNHYQKLFNEVAKLNEGAAALQNTTVVGRLVEENDKQTTEGRAAFAGVNAKTADKIKLKTAEQMLADGADSETVRKETGWFKGYDGKWRFEIDDSDIKIAFNGKFSRDPDVRRYAELVEKVYFVADATVDEQSELAALDKKLSSQKIEPVKLGDMITHTALFEAYPQLEDVNIRFVDGLGSTNGMWDAQFNEIVLAKSLKMDKKRATKTLLHEIQHAIQYYEGFTYGASPEYWAANPIFAEEGNERLHAAQKKLDDVYQKFRKEWKDDINWNLAKEYKRLQELWWESSDTPYYEQKMREIEEAAQEAGFDELLDEYLAADAEFEIAKSTAKKISSEELYQRTAGEIEARDVANRVDLTAEQRKNTRPDIDRTDVVFAEGSSVSYFAKGEYDAETAGIKDQIRNSQDILNKMNVVYSGIVPTHFENRLQSKKWAVEELSKRGFKADRKDFGIIEFSEKDIYGALDHLDSDQERAAIAAIYHVLKRGIQIGEHGNHKLRQKHTVTFAAPVEINGVRANMAAVVNMRNKKYYVHRIIMPDGSSFKFSENKNADQEAQRGVPKGSLANATSSASMNSILDSAEKSNSFDKNSSKNADSGGRSALAKGKTADNTEVIDSPWIASAERESIVSLLQSETQTDEEKDTLRQYTTELGVLEDKLIERSGVLKELDAAKKEKNKMYADAKTREERKTVAASTKMKAIKQSITALEDQIVVIENEISRRDSELLRISSIKPLRDLVIRAYKLGKEDGATARVSQGLVNKRVAAFLHSKFFTLKDGISIVDKIHEKYPISDFNVRSELARKLWTQMNATENLTEQKAELRKIAADVVKAVNSQVPGDVKKDLSFVKRIGKYEKRIVFSEWERKTLVNYYGAAHIHNTIAKFEYDGKKDVEPKTLRDMLWDAGNAVGMENYGALSSAGPADRADAFFTLVKEYEQALSATESARDIRMQQQNDIQDILVRGFLDGGKETYKQKYDELSNTVKIRNRIEQHAKDYTNLIKGTFANATSDDGKLFVNTLDQIPKIMYRGTLYDGRARKVAKGLAEWYNKDNSMLGYDESKKDPGLYRQDIKDRLDTLAEGDEQRHLTEEELKMLDDVLRYFHHFVEHYNKIFRNNMWEDALPVAEGYMKKARIQENSKPMQFEILFRNKYVKNFGDSESVMRICDGYEDGIFTSTYNEIREGYIAARVLEMHTMENYEDFIRRNPKFVADKEKESVNYRGKNVPKSALYGYYMSLEREHLQAGLALSGFVYERVDGTGKDVIPGFLSEFDAEKIDREAIKQQADSELKRLKNLFDEKDMEYINLVRSTYEIAGNIKYEADMNRYGYSNIAEGRYYPGRRYAAGQNAGLDMHTEMATTDRFTNASFNKNVVKGAKQALYIENPDAVLRRHIKNLSLYAKLSPAVDNFNRLWRLDVAGNANLPTSLQTMMDQNKRAWRIDKKLVGYEYLKTLIADIMGGSKSGSPLLSFLRKNYATFALGGVIGANPKVALTQFSSLIASTSMLDPDVLFKSARIKGYDVDKYCALAELRNKEETVVKAQGVTEKISGFGEKTTSLINKVDRLVVVRLFAACQVQVSKNKRLPLGTERNKIAAGKLLHEVILKTQQNALITERTESMRSTSELNKMLSMFRSDSIKNTGRLIDAMGEKLYVKAQIKTKGKNASPHLTRRNDKANKRLARCWGSLIVNSLNMVAVAKLFEWLYAKDDDDEKPWWLEGIIDFGGNMLGGLPVVSQLYSRFIEGYDFEGFEYSMINDLLDSTEQIGKLVLKAINGKATSDDILGSIERSVDSTGQMLGIPTRNIRNTLYGLTKRILPTFAYRVDDLFGDKQYASDLNDAIEKGDVQMATTILELALGEKLGSGLSDAARDELVRLSGLGEKMIPSAISDTVTIDGEERTLTGKELSAVREKYAEAVERINSFIDSELYESYSDEQKASAVRKIYSLYKDLAYDSVMGAERNPDMLILSGLIDADVLCAWVSTGVLTSDKDENGKTIAGSKREKVVRAISSLDVSGDERLLLIALKGYSLADGDIRGVSAYAAKVRLYNYIAELEGLTDEERLELYEASGFEVKNGEAEYPRASESSSGNLGGNGGRLGNLGGKLGNLGGKLSKSGGSLSSAIIKVGKLN